MIIFLIFVVLLVSGILLYKFGDDEITAVAVFEILSLFVGSLGVSHHRMYNPVFPR